MRQDLPPWVDRYVGAHYKEGGRALPEIDCWGLVVAVWRDLFSFEAPSFEGVTWRNSDKGERAQSVAEIAAAINSDVDRYIVVPPGSERAGDGILLRMRGAPMHVGVVVAPGAMLHIEEGCDACVEEYGGIRWKGRVLGFYRPGCAN